MPYDSYMATETSNTGRESDKFMLRLPEGMRDRLKVTAQANNRTLNAEIVARLTEHLNGPVAKDLTFSEIVDALTKVHAHTLKDGGVTIRVEVVANSEEKIYPSRDAHDAAIPKTSQVVSGKAGVKAPGGTKRGRSHKAS